MTGFDADGIEWIQSLAELFPALRHLPEVQHWNPMALDAWAIEASPAERLAAQFVLRTWNGSHQWRCGTFDEAEASRTWDRDQWAAYCSLVQGASPVQIPAEIDRPPLYAATRF